MPGARARAMVRQLNRVADEVSSFAPVPTSRDRFKSAVNIVKVTNRFQLAGKGELPKAKIVTMGSSKKSAKARAMAGDADAKVSVVFLGNQWVTAPGALRPRNQDLFFWSELRFDEKTGPSRPARNTHPFFMF